LPAHALPDLNTGYITYRREILTNLKSENYRYCIGALYTLNGMLPETYQIEISTIRYNEITQQKLLATCKHCEIVSDYTNLKIVNTLLPLVEGMIIGKDHEKMWYCNNCHKYNKLSQTDLGKNVPIEPYFLKVVPKPPERRDGIVDRLHYKKNIENWVITFLIEVEHQMGKYRREYVPKGDRDEENMEMIDYGGEELDVIQEKLPI